MKQCLKTEETHLFTKANIGTGHTLFYFYDHSNQHSLNNIVFVLERKLKKNKKTKQKKNTEFRKEKKSIAKSIFPRKKVKPFCIF